MLPVNPKAKENIMHTRKDEENEKPVLSMEEMKSVISDVRKMTNSSNMKKVVGSLDVQRKRQKFCMKVETILEKFGDIVLANNDERLQIVCLFVMQSAADYLHYDDKDKVDALCVELLKRFVNNDENLMRNVMNIVKQKIKPMTMYRKCKHMLSRSLGVFFSSKLSNLN